MSTGEQQAPSGEVKRRAGTFKPGFDPKRAGCGRKRVTPEDRERARQARIALDRAVADVQGELRAMTGPAIDRLRKLLDSKDEAIALRAATDIISRVNGLPVATTLLHAEMHAGEGTRRLTADDIQAAAKLYLLRQGAQTAVEAQEAAE